MAFLARLLACLALVAACVNAAPIAVSSAPAAFPAQDFLFDMCGPGAPQWPLRVDDMCSSWGWTNPANAKQACDMIDMVRMMLGSPALAPLRCEPGMLPPPPSSDAAGRVLPLPLLDAREGGVLPHRFTPQLSQHLLRAEGASHLWLWKHVVGLSAWAPCGALGKAVPWAAPPGWELLRVLHIANDLAPYSLTATSLPLGAVLRRSATAESAAGCSAYLAEHAPLLGASTSSEDAAAAEQHEHACAGDQLLVVLRGTGSLTEWGYDLDYALDADASYGAGEVHRGFRNVTEQLWRGGLKALVDEHVLGAGGAGGSPVHSVTFAGHSLGAAAAALLAAKTQKYVAAAAAAGAVAPLAAGHISAALFALPNVGDAAFTADFNSRVNARSLRYKADVIPQLPCAGSMPLCPSSEAGAAAWVMSAGSRLRSRRRASVSALSVSDGAVSNVAGAADAAVDAAGSGSDEGVDASAAPPGGWRFVHYAELGGQLVLEPAGMPHQRAAWHRLSTYQQSEFCDDLNTVNGLALAVHICSYTCHLSQAAGPGVADKHNWCLLWPEAGGASGEEDRLWPSNATFCQQGSRNTFPMQPVFPHMT